MTAPAPSPAAPDHPAVLRELHERLGDLAGSSVTERVRFRASLDAALAAVEAQAWRPIDDAVCVGDLIGGYDENGEWEASPLGYGDDRAWDMWHPPITHYLPASALPAPPVTP